MTHEQEYLATAKRHLELAIDAIVKSSRRLEDTDPESFKKATLILGKTWGEMKAARNAVSVADKAINKKYADAIELRRQLQVSG